jgi:phenylpropionate dioxygenase-like ring-hydroxylating dioxygenase large terminal subunit
VRSRLSSRYYWNQELFDLEMKRVFAPLWIFAGIKAELPKNNSFFLRKWGQTEVIVSRSGDDITALENTCPHRLSPIHTESEGCRPLVCKYHGWSFNGDGSLRKIPLEESIYRYPESEKKQAYLKRFHVKIVGEFIFVSLADKPVPFTRQFSPRVIADLEVISNNLDSIYMKRTQRRRFNWKLAYENLRDPNHVRFVHPTTIATWTKFEDPQIPVRLDAQTATIRSLSFGGPDAEIPNLAPEVWHTKVKRWTMENKYYNWLLYPNLHLVSASCGHSFSFEYHHPVSPTETDVVIYMITTKRTEPEFDPTQVLEDHFAGAQVILDEDYIVLERIQAQMDGKDRTPLLGDYEWLNIRIESWYLRTMHPWSVLNPLFLLRWPLSGVRAITDYIGKHGMKALVRRLKEEFA